MSNTLAVGTVTAVLAHVISEQVTADVSGATVTTKHPADVDGSTAPKLNVFLFHVAPNMAQRTRDLPTRNESGALRQRPRVALDLLYLLSAHGDAEKFEPERMLASALVAMHRRPVLTSGIIGDTLSSLGGGSPLATSDLADTKDRVRLTLEPMSIEDLTRLWGAFSNTAMVASAVLRAGAVVVEPAHAPGASTPVQKVLSYVVPFRRPVLRQAEDADAPSGPITGSSEVRLLGTNLRGSVTAVRLGDVEHTSLTGLSDTTLMLDLATVSGLRAGIVPVRVVHYESMGDPPANHDGPSSNPLPVVIRPEITVSSVTSAEITIGITPAVAAGQKVTLALVKTDGSERFLLETESDGSSLTFPATALTAATSYLARVEVDGAESLLTHDGSGFTGPLVTTP